jgi:hypothetical protein
MWLLSASAKNKKKNKTKKNKKKNLPETKLSFGLTELAKEISK